MHDAEIAAAEQWLAALTEQVASVGASWGASVGSARSSTAWPGGPTHRRPRVGPFGHHATSTALTRVQAVERALVRSGSALHLREIESVLRSHGRPARRCRVISATLAYLKRQRGTVRCVGRGRWEATADAAIPAPDVENVDQHWFADRAVDHTADRTGTHRDPSTAHGAVARRRLIVA